MEFAENRGHTAAEAAIQWVVSHPVISSAIVEISRMEQLEANLKAFDWELTPTERSRIGGYFKTEVWEEHGGAFADWRRSYDIC